MHAVATDGRTLLHSVCEWPPSAPHRAGVSESDLLGTLQHLAGAWAVDATVAREGGITLLHDACKYGLLQVRRRSG